VSSAIPVPFAPGQATRSAHVVQASFRSTCALDGIAPRKGVRKGWRSAVALGRARALEADAVVQSSGRRIQPCFMAYTTAWVRSFTDNLRRMLDMWFLTVCSLIVSA
jgi:hypothetical protein